MPRSYRKEYDNYQGKPDQKKKRAMRNKARRMMTKAGKVRKGDGMDVNHRSGNAMDSRKSNLDIKTKSKNRSFARTRSARKKKILKVK